MQSYVARHELRRVHLYTMFGRSMTSILRMYLGMISVVLVRKHTLRIDEIRGPLCNPPFVTERAVTISTYFISRVHQRMLSP